MAYNPYFKSRRKYGNSKVTVQGITFDSKKEAARFQELSLMEKSGIIQDLKRQVKFQLIPPQYDENGKCVERSVNYIADFVYRQNEVLTVEDVKGFKTPEYILKRKLMLQLYKIRIKEV